MKTFAQALATGGLVSIIGKMPLALAGVTILGLAVFGASELTHSVAEGWYAPAVERGKGAQGDAQSNNIHVAIKRFDTGEALSGADASIGQDVLLKHAQAVKEAATGGKEGADAVAMTATTEQLRRKKLLGKPLTTTEELQLIKVETAEQELRKARAAADKEAADAKIKTAESTAADAKATADIATSAYTKCMLERGFNITMQTVLDGREPCTRSR